MSLQDTKNNKPKKSGHKSLLFSLWEKLSGGGKELAEKEELTKQEQKTAPSQEQEGEEKPIQPEELAYEKTPAPPEFMEYYLLYCQAQGQEAQKSTAEDFCTGDAPEAQQLKRIFSQVESKASAVMKQHRKQAQLALRQAELRLKELNEEPVKKPTLEEIEESLPVDGQVLIFAAPDLSAAWGLMLPPLWDGLPITREEVLDALEKQSIFFGVDQEAAAWLTAPENALSLRQLAACVPPEPGVDGKTIEYFPRTVGTPQILENEQGIVDFDNLNWLTHIDAGTVICDIVHPTQGKPGTNIQGNPIRPYNGKKVALPQGENVVLNEDRTKLISKIDGQISFRGGKFHVNNVINISGDVDLSTGSINVQGDVIISGNVMAGFTVTASGNVTIGGLAENCQITAGGSVIVNRGMNGNVTGSITAGKDIVCKYMENATVLAEGEIRMDCIVNCDVSAKGKVIVNTGRGSIIGGIVRSMGGIEAKTIGNIAGRLTTLSIGAIPSFLEEKALIEERLMDIQQEIDMQGDTGRASLLKLKIKPLEKALEEMEFEEAAAAQKRIVAGTLYPMAQVTINNVNKTIADSYSPCRIYWDSKEGIIKIANF